MYDSYQHKSLGRHDCQPVRLRDSLAAQSIESLRADVVKYTTDGEKEQQWLKASHDVKARTVPMQHATVSTASTKEWEWLLHVVHSIMRDRCLVHVAWRSERLALYKSARLCLN